MGHKAQNDRPRVEAGGNVVKPWAQLYLCAYSQRRGHNRGPLALEARAK